MTDLLLKSCVGSAFTNLNCLQICAATEWGDKCRQKCPDVYMCIKQRVCEPPPPCECDPQVWQTRTIVMLSINIILLMVSLFFMVLYLKQYRRSRNSRTCVDKTGSELKTPLCSQACPDILPHKHVVDCPQEPVHMDEPRYPIQQREDNALNGRDNLPPNAPCDQSKKRSPRRVVEPNNVKAAPKAEDALVTVADTVRGSHQIQNNTPSPAIHFNDQRSSKAKGVLRGASWSRGDTNPPNTDFQNPNGRLQGAADSSLALMAASPTSGVQISGSNDMDLQTQDFYIESTTCSSDRESTPHHPTNFGYTSQ